MFFKIKVWAIVFILGVFSVTTSAQSTIVSFDTSVENLRVLALVDHVSHSLVIGDETYSMPLNFKVYKNNIVRNVLSQRSVGRYALKPGQKVYINSYFKNRTFYVQELLIVE